MNGKKVKVIRKLVYPESSYRDRKYLEERNGRRALIMVEPKDAKSGEKTKKVPEIIDLTTIKADFSRRTYQNIKDVSRHLTIKEIKKNRRTSNVN